MMCGEAMMGASLGQERQPVQDGQVRRMTHTTLYRHLSGASTPSASTIESFVFSLLPRRECECVFFEAMAFS
jgi:hypothetical protein